MTACLGISVVQAYAWLHVSALISHQRTTTDDNLQTIGRTFTEIYTVNTLHFLND
jgi:hypothetical protein